MNLANTEITEYNWYWPKYFLACQILSKFVILVDNARVMM